MTFARTAVGGLLIGLGVGIWIGAALVAGEDMNGMSVVPSLLLAMAGGFALSKEWREMKGRP